MGPPAAENGTTLFSHKVSPYALRAQIAMVEKGIPFNAVIVDLRNKPKGLLDANPFYGKVPSLVHNGNSVVESLIILEYLDDAFPDTVPLLPKDPLARSKCRFWADYVAKSEETVFPGVMAALGSPEKEAAKEAYGKYLQTIDSAISEFSKEGPFFCGEKFGYLDVIMAPSLIWGPYFNSAGVTMLDNVPRLKKCFEAISEQKSVKDVLPPLEEVPAYMAFILANPRK